MLAHGEDSAASALLRGGRTTCSDFQLEQLRTVRLWSHANVEVRVPNRDAA